jgi:hypothetical protein
MSVAAVANILGKRRKSLSRSGSGWALTGGARLVAKVDSAAVQDGFDLYLHDVVVTNDGRWVVVQQNSPMVAHQISLSMGASIA